MTIKTNTIKSNTIKSKKNIIKKDKIINKITKKQLNNFPLYANSYNLNIRKIIKLSKNNKTKLKKYIKNSLNIINKLTTFDNTNKYYIIYSNWYDDLELNNLTDYFTEDNRLTCKFINNPSVMEYWNENKSMIISKLKQNNKEINNNNVKEFIYSINRKIFCNNFRVSLCLEVLNIFKPKSWLDISAGWGDRLISAILSPWVKYYCGVDPNPNLHPQYQNIIKTLDPDNKKKCILIKDGFENADLPSDKFDLVFSSPPFFTLEKYSNSVNNSVNKYGTINSWFDGFLMPSIKKGIDKLNKGGYLVLYIDELDSNENYIPKMIMETNKLINNAGCFYYSSNKNKYRPFYCWKKY